MDRNVVIGISIVLALVVAGGAYYFFMPRPADTNEDTPAPESVNDVARPNEETAASLDGTWKSKDDARFVRSFTANGTVTDRYEGDDSATVSGTWSFVADPTKEQAELPVVKDAKILKLQFPEEVMYFALTELSETDLSMIYLSGNGSLRFTRVQ